MTISIDFESFSRCDLKKCGTSRYAEDPSTEVLCLAWATDPSDVRLWIPGQPAPHELFNLMGRHKMRAWNAYFELRIWKEVCTKRMGWPEVDVDNFVDTQADALALSLPDSLDACASALKTMHQKDAQGKRLINTLCKPVKPTKAHPTDRWTKQQAHNDHILLYDYCKQDVRTEMAISAMLPYSVTEKEGMEREIWKATVRANERGIPIDVELVTSVSFLLEEKIARLTEELRHLTGGLIQTTNQNVALQAFLNDRFLGGALTNMQGITLEACLKDDIAPEARRLLEIYQQANYASVAKYKKMLMQLCSDGTIKDNHLYHGAATGRDAGRGVQVQNLPRATVDDPEFAIEIIKERNLDRVECVFGNIIELASALIRPSFCAPEGTTFFNADLSQIEARKTCWIAREQDLLDDYRNGRDAYKSMAAKMYHKGYEDVEKVQRQAGKIAVLACGFQGGSNALIGMAENYGIEFADDEADQIVKAFRTSRPKLVATWKAFAEAAREAVNNPANIYPVETNERFKFFVKGIFLFMLLPNKRLLAFPFPRWEEVKAPWSTEEKPAKIWQVTHMHLDSTRGRKWLRRAISGASLMQSAVQGLSRDILMEGILRLEEVGFPHLFRVHDEVTCSVDEFSGQTLENFTEIFSQVPEWCSDLPIAADPWQGERYHK
jgi:DNA polymerase bacteriophage-type